MAEYDSEETRMVEMEEKGVGQQMATNLRGLLRSPRVPAFWCGGGEKLRIDRSRVVYGLSDRETVFSMECYEWKGFRICWGTFDRRPPANMRKVRGSDQTGVR